MCLRLYYQPEHHILQLGGRSLDIYVDIYERMPVETRRGKLDSSTTVPEPTKTNMAAANVSTNREPDDVEPDIDSVPNRKLLLQILGNQKSSEKKSEERFDKLTKQVNEAKSTLDTYKAENEKVIGDVRTTVNTTVTDLKGLQAKLTSLESQLTATTNRLDDTQEQLKSAQKERKEHSKVLRKLDKKYLKDEEEFRRCTLLIDGANERDNKRPKVVIETPLKDLGVEYKEADIRSAYRLGPIRTRISRPRSIKITFASSTTKGEIFKDIDKLKNLDAWKGIRLSDAISPLEQNQQRHLRCIYAVARAQNLNVKLRGSTIIFDDIKYTYKDIESLPHGLTMEKAKIVNVSDGVAFQSHHAFMSNMFICLIKHEGIEYKSAEHFYSAEMARFHDRLDLIDDILGARDGYAAKRIVRSIKIKDEWHITKIEIMKKIITSKFDQNDSLRDRLIQTKGFLYEATKADLDFACGFTLSQAKEISKNKITGKYILGELLVEYRDNILGRV